MKNQQDYSLARGRINQHGVWHTATSKYKRQLMKTVVRMRTNEKNMKMRSRNPSQEVESRFLKVNCS